MFRFRIIPFDTHIPFWIMYARPLYTYLKGSDEGEILGRKLIAGVCPKLAFITLHRVSKWRWHA